MIDPTCSICLCEIQDLHANVMTRCNHAFHINCLSAWTKLKSTCPYCRANLEIRSGSSYKLVAQVAHQIESSVFLSGETQVLPISKFVVDTETGEVALVRNASAFGHILSHF